MTTRANRTWWVLRVGAAACFIGHGAFGVIGKEAWLPFFALVGIGPEWAFRLMPVIGTVDILAGISVLLSPRPVVLLYMSVWAVWTAALRPITGDSVAELFERAGNYGVPFALLLLCQWPSDLRGWLRAAHRRELTDGLVRRVALVLILTTATLLAGHAALGLNGKPGLTQHYAAIGFGDDVTRAVGGFESVLVALVLLVPAPIVAAFIAGWKLATEFLFIIAGAPIWEWIERGGSYAAPLALLTIARRYSLPRLSFGALVPRPTIVGAIILVVVVAASADAQSGAESELLARLRRGGLVLACRHAATDHAREDQMPIDYADRTAQRNLSSAGEQQARELGAAIHAAGIPIGDVYSHPLFRTKETATLAFGRTIPVDSLGDGAVLRRMMSLRVDGGNRVFVTRNGMLMTAFRGIAQVSFAEGDCAVVEPNDASFSFIAKLTPEALGKAPGGSDHE